MEYYIGIGNSGQTYGIHSDGQTYIQIEFPNGDLGNINKLEKYNGWNLPRWKGQMDVRESEKDEMPQELIEYVESQED